MLALLKKDWRLNRVPIIGGGLLIAVPYLFVIPVLLTSNSNNSGVVYEDLMAVSIIATALNVAIAAVFGGTAFALERRERSADFLALLPITRGKIIASKMLIGIGIPAIYFTINVIIAAAAQNQGHPAKFEIRDTFLAHASAAILMLMAFGIGWCLSSFLSSPAISASIAIGIMLAWPALYLLVTALFKSPLGAVSTTIIAITPILIGVLGVAVGSINYLKRVEP
jgi:ABC-type transport system involved in multi-copper enzyme maturation permease subunit